MAIRADPEHEYRRSEIIQAFALAMVLLVVIVVWMPEDKSDWLAYWVAILPAAASISIILRDPAFAKLNRTWLAVVWILVFSASVYGFVDWIRHPAPPPATQNSNTLPLER